MQLRTLIVALSTVALLAGQDHGARAPTSKPAAKAFVYPCTGYLRGLRDGGNFGAHIRSKGSPFDGSWHLAEDVWLAAGTEVRSMADGIVRYSAFSPTWTDDQKRVHWNLGNVIVIEHVLDPPLDELGAICSLYVHLGADRRVQVGERVTVGQVIGRIGADRSEENGRYPAHLHFGIHRGPYLQIPPAFELEIRRAARSKDGFSAGSVVLHGEVELRMNGEDSVLITSQETRANILLSLLVGSTAPKAAPPDIMCWCEGYGREETVAEWLQPSKFLARNIPQTAATATPKPAVIRVLFLGNSYTYVNDLPALVRALGRSAKPAREFEVESIAPGGCTLEMHAAEEGSHSPRTRIAQGKFDFVVLQEQSLRPIVDPQAMLVAARALGAAAADAKSTPVWYVTWARAKEPEKQDSITAAYESCASAVGGRVAPVGPAWKEALASKGAPNLYDDDGSHPSGAGSYLAALVLYATITGDDLDNLPSKLVERDPNGRERVLLDLPERDAAALRKAADKALAVRRAAKR